MVGNRIATGLSATALIVALLGSTSAGTAALDAVVPVPLAKRAYLADTAKNAIKVNNLKASATPTPGMLVALDSSGKLPVSIGAVGPQGPAGPKGDTGNKGRDGTKNVVLRVSQPVLLGPGETTSGGVLCANGERAVGGGAGNPDGSFSGGSLVIEGRPAIPNPSGKAVPAVSGSTPTGWAVWAQNDTYPGRANVAFYAICVS